VREKLHYEIMGWQFITWDEREPDVIKTFHIAKNKETGEEVYLDLSPYTMISVEEFRMMVEMKFPRRDAIKSIGPLYGDDIRALYAKKQLELL